jgi:cytochrome oxidase Cu insertion factor (SCO1/SenC/PrrC family)
MNKLTVRIGLVLIASGILVLAIAQVRSGSETRNNPAYGQVPAFSLTESSGRTVGQQELSGKVWVADFIFTSCAGTCPLMTAQMRKLQDLLPHDIGLVSFSVDPKRDTPEVMARYAQQFQADPQRWLFLTGDRQTLYNITVNGFKLALDDSQGTEQEPITHSSRFVLVDKNLNIRSYYSGTEDADLKKLVQDAKSLL